MDGDNERISKEPGQNTKGSATKGRQQPANKEPAAGRARRRVEARASDDECEESPLDVTLTLERELDSASIGKGLPQSPESMCWSDVEISASCLSKQDTIHSCGSAIVDSHRGIGQACYDAIHSTRQQEPAIVDSESRATRATRTKGNSSSSSSRSSSASRGPDSTGWRDLWANSGSGADGDNDDTDTTRSGASSVDLVELYDDTIEALEEEKQKEEYIMGAIGSCMELVSSTSSDVRSYALELFGKQSLTGDTFRKRCRSRRKSPRLQVAEEDAREPSADFERRLEAIKVYLDGGSDEAEGKREAKAKVEVFKLPVTEKNACTLASTTKQKTEATAECSKCDTTATDSKTDEFRGEVTNDNDKEAYSESLRKRTTARKSWEHTVVAKICAIVEQRVLKVKVSCQMMLSCMKSVANIVNLAMEAYKVTQVAIQKAKACRSHVASDILRAVTDAATETSTWMWKALSDAETAVRIHTGIVEAIERTERSLYGVRMDDCVDEAVVKDVTAAVDDIEMLIERTALVRLDVPRGEERAEGPAGDAPAPSAGDVAATAPLVTKDADGNDRVPADVLQALLAATKSSLKAAEATVRALEFFSACETCVRVKLKKRSGPANKTRR